MKIKTPSQHKYYLFERSRRVRHIALRISHQQPRRTCTAMKFIMTTTSRCFAATVNTTNCRLLSVEINAIKNSRFFRYVKIALGVLLVVVVEFKVGYGLLIRSVDIPFLFVLSFSCSVLCSLIIGVRQSWVVQGVFIKSSNT